MATPVNAAADDGGAAVGAEAGGAGRNVLIIGSAGYVGRRMAAGFARNGYTVSVLSRPGGTPVNPAYRAVTGDLTDPDSLREAARGFDWVVNLGAILGEEVDVSSVEALIAAGSPLIHTSGSDVLGAGHVHEDSEPVPHPIVGWRARVDRIVLRAGGRVVRPGLIYGGGGGVMSNMMVPLAQRLGAGVYIGEPGVRWGAVHVEDLPSLYMAVAEKAPPGTCWNGIAENVRVDRLARLVGNGKAISWPVEAPPPPEIEPIAGLYRLDQVVSSEKTQRELGWKPRYTDAVAALAEEYLAAGIITEYDGT
jgi:nucleoside-diphosphate-sugar epimerase